MYLEVKFQSQPGEEAELNRRWRTERGDVPRDLIVQDESAIRLHIEYIQSDPEQAPSRWIRTVDDWNRAYPTHQLGRGTAILQDDDDGEVDPARLSDFRRTVEWVLANRALFSEIENLDELRNYPELGLDEIVGRTEPMLDLPKDEQASFAELPARPGNRIYEKCKEFDVPGLWSAYLNYRESPTAENWEHLRVFEVPWATTPGATVNDLFILCEERRMQAEGGNAPVSAYGASPAIFQVERALRDPASLERTQVASPSRALKP